MISVVKDFSNLDEFAKSSKEILFQISYNREQLRKLILGVPENPQLFSLCAHYDAVDKIVLMISSDQKIQLRMHIYSNLNKKSISSSQVDIAQAHNHRWNFSSFILSGGYRHTIYSIVSSLEDPSTYRLVPAMIRQESIGDCYTLHHSQYHSLIEEPNTVTLLIRGPLEKEHFQIVSEMDGEVTWQDGSSLESIEEKTQKKMEQARYRNLVDKLINLGII